MPLSDIANVTILLETGGIQSGRFRNRDDSRLLSMSGWTERTRTYSSMTGVAADFAATTPEYKAANAYFAQQPHRAACHWARRPSNRRWLSKSPWLRSTTRRKYSVSLNGTQFDYTSDGTATNDGIILDLRLQSPRLPPQRALAAVAGVAHKRTSP